MSRQRSMETILQSEYVTIGELVRLTDVRYSTQNFFHFHWLSLIEIVIERTEKCLFFGKRAGYGHALSGPGEYAFLSALNTDAARKLQLQHAGSEQADETVHVEA